MSARTARRPVPRFASSLVLGALLAAPAPAAFAAEAADPVRDQLVGEVEALFTGAALVPPDSATIDAFLKPVVDANPNTLPAVWAEVRAELAVGLRQLLTAPGSPLELALRRGLSTLSVADLRRLRELLADPAYRKFQIAMADPALLREFERGLLLAGVSIAPVLDGILARHHLTGAPH